MTKQYEAVNDYLMFLWNTTNDEFLFALFGKRYNEMPEHQQWYVEKFLVAKQSDPASIWSMLDRDNQQKLLDAANARYGRGEEE
tara:strand:- start:10208 stop:10459 length:252 start_codon:yes stop_codon:yes gene_type:complete